MIDSPGSESFGSRLIPGGGVVGSRAAGRKRCKPGGSGRGGVGSRRYSRGRRGRGGRCGRHRRHRRHWRREYDSTGWSSVGGWAAGDYTTRPDVHGHRQRTGSANRPVTRRGWNGSQQRTCSCCQQQCRRHRVHRRRRKCLWWQWWRCRDCSWWSRVLGGCVAWRIHVEKKPSEKKQADYFPGDEYEKIIFFVFFLKKKN